MAKSLSEFNKHYRFNKFLEAEQKEQQAKKTTPISIISSVIFYFVLFAIVASAFIYSQQAKVGNNIFGISYYNILTDSMTSVYPRGTFILVKATKEQDLQVGDDITFMESETKIITHRIIEIIENHDDSNMRGFKTQGVDNPAPDKEIVFYGNVIGRVIWNVPMLGFILDYIVTHLLIVIIAIFILFAFAMCLKIFFGPEKRKAPEIE
jgi:signal peptidase I, archaeal type